MVVRVEKEMLAYKKQSDNNTFYYLKVGSEYHFKPSFIMWVSSKLVSKNEDGKEVVTFPAKARIVRTEKGTLVMKPDDQHIVYNISVKSGYRGNSKFEVIEPKNAEVYKYYLYASEAGSCGVSAGALVVVTPPQKIVVRWERSGRLYGGAEKGITIIYPSGEIEEFEEVEDLEDLKKVSV